MRQRVIKFVLIACTAALLALPVAGYTQQRDIMLVLDNSGSMKKNDPEFLTAVAVKAFIRDLRGDVHLGILIFDEAVDLAVPLSPLDVDTRGRYLDSLSRITFRGQWTHSSAALERALYELRNSGRLLAEKSIVFMTDGIVDTGDAARDVERTRWIQTELADSAAESGVRVFGIAFTDNADFQLIQSLAHRSGGEYYRAYQATDIERVFESINSSLGAGGTTATPEPVPYTPLESTTVPLPAETPPSPTLPQAQPPSVTVLEPVLPQPSIETLAFPRDDQPTAAAEPPPIDLPTLTMPSPTAPVPSAMPQPDTTPAPVPGVMPQPDTTPAPVPSSTGDGTSFLDELNAPPTPAIAAADTARSEPPTAEPVSDAAGKEAAGDAAERPAPEAPLPLLWMLLGGGVLAVLVGAGVFLLVRRRRKVPVQSSVPKAFLNDLGGATDKSSHELGAQPTVIGRILGPDTEGAVYIVIDESTIGRRHAIIEFTEHAYWVADQNSLNGTFVNGKRITERTRLKHGDRLKFHRKEFEFVLWDMFETDRTEMSQTMFTNMLDSAEPEDDEATQMRDKSQPGNSSTSTTGH